MLETVSSWGGRNLNAHEELSCSYQPSRKKREDIVYNGLQYPSFMTKRLIECDSSDDVTTPRLISEMQYENNFINHNDHNKTDFDISEKSFESLRRNMDLPRARR